MLKSIRTKCKLQHSLAKVVNIGHLKLFKDRTNYCQFLINVSTASIHLLDHPLVAERPAYSLTKASGALAVQLLANTGKADSMQVITFHPGILYSDAWLKLGITEEMIPSTGIPFDDVSLPAGFAVWASSKEAAFLHGRFVWSFWDVDELAKGDTRARINGDAGYLRIGMMGMKGPDRG